MRVGTAYRGLRPAAGFDIHVAAITEQGSDGFAVEARASLAIRLHERPDLCENAKLDQLRSAVPAEDRIDLLADRFQRKRFDQCAMRAGLQTIQGRRFVG